MNIRTIVHHKYNFTGRAKIRQKPELFKVSLNSRDANSIALKVEWDRESICRDAKLTTVIDQLLVLDVLFLGNYNRFVLEKSRSEDVFSISDCPDNAILDFRLKVVSNEEGSKGALLAASSFFKLTDGNQTDYEQDAENPFFDLKPSDSLGGRIWSVDWSNESEPVILINRDYHQKFSDTPLVAAHLYPEIVREMATGLLFRFSGLDEVEEGTKANSWLTFFEQKLGCSLRGEQGASLETADSKLELIAQINDEFSNTHWRDGKTLLQEYLKK